MPPAFSSSKKAASVGKKPPTTDVPPPAISEKATQANEDGGNDRSEGTPAADAKAYRVQVGVFQDVDNARKMADRLAGAGYQPSMTTSKSSGGTLYRVQAGPFQGRKAAETAVRDLSQQGIPARLGGE
jgi:cell division septation protein DedD